MSDTTNWLRYEIPNRQVKPHADQIADAAILLFEHMLRINCVPSVLLESALAIELYLKALSSETIFDPIGDDPADGFHVTADPTKHTHRLQELFDAIDKPIRDELQQAYAGSSVIAGVSLLRDALGRYNDLFVETRYIFSLKHWQGNSISDLMRLLKFMRRQISAMPTRYRVG